MWLQNTNYIYYTHVTRGKETSLDFKDRYQTAVKMNLKKTTLNSEFTLANLKELLRQITERLLENPDCDLAQNDWRYGIRFAGIDAFYQISKEERYKNELRNIQQYQTEENDDIDEEEIDLCDLIWSYRIENDLNALQKIESLTLEDFDDYEVSLAFASQIYAVKNYENYMLAIDQVKANYTKSIGYLLEVLQSQYFGKTSRIKALMIYSVTAGLRNGYLKKSILIQF